jgi:hypothetical protein
MKKALVIFILVSIALISFRQVEDKGLARVNRYQGYFVFVQSQPINEYDVLGTVKKTGVVWTGSPDEMFNILIRRMKKDYPTADGIIFDDVAMEHATCIKFK